MVLKLLPWSKVKLLGANKGDTAGFSWVLCILIFFLWHIVFQKILFLTLCWSEPLQIASKRAVWAATYSGRA